MSAKSVVKNDPGQTVLPAAEGQIAPFDHPMLADETKVHIFSGLNPTELSIASLVCREWKALISDNFVWRVVLGRDFKVFKTENPKELYQHLYRINRNLGMGIYTTRVIQIGAAIKCYCFEGRKLFLGCSDHTIKVLDSDTGICETTLNNAPYLYVLCLIDDQKLASGDMVGNINIWNLQTGACEKQIPGYGLPVNAFVLTPDGNLIAGYRGGKVIIWDLATYEIVKELPANSDGSSIGAMILGNQGTFITGDWDKTIKVLNAKTGEEIKIIEADTEVVTSSLILTEKNKVISSDWKGNIRIWDLQTGLCERTFVAYPCGVFSMCLSDQEKLVTTSNEKTFKVWDLATNTLKGEFGTHSGEVNFVAFQDGEKLILGSSKGTIQILDLTASDSDVFEELAIGFEENKLDPEILMERFRRMPERARGKIYAELESIRGNCSSADYPDIGRLAFHGLEGQTSTPEQKAEAIRNYLSRESAPQTDEGEKEV